MAKEHFKFDSNLDGSRTYPILMIGKSGMKQCVKYCPLWEVDTIERVAMFACGHESAVLEY